MLAAMCEVGLMLTIEDVAHVECHIGQWVFGHTGVIAAKDRVYGKQYGRMISNYYIVFEDPFINSWWLRHCLTCQGRGNPRAHKDRHTLWSNCPINTQSFSSCKTCFIKVIYRCFILLTDDHKIVWLTEMRSHCVRSDALVSPVISSLQGFESHGGVICGKRDSV